MMKKESGWAGSWKSTLLWTVIVIAVFTLVQSIQGGGHSLTAEVDDSRVGIVCDRYDAVFLELDEIEDLQLVDSMETFVPSGGGQDRSFTYGSFESDLYGSVTVMAWTERSKFILIRTADSALLFNCSRDRDTEKTYDEIVSAREERIAHEKQ